MTPTPSAPADALEDDRPPRGIASRLPRRRVRDRVAEGPPQARLSRALMVVGALLLPLGAAVVLLGWYGAAHTPFVFEQIPYLISGGLLGVALAAGGGMLYFGGWLARLADEQRRSTDLLVEAVQGLRDDLQGQQRVAASPGDAVPSTTFVATPSGTMFHRADCAVVAGRSDVRAVDPAANGLRPCGMCAPTAADVG